MASPWIGEDIELKATHRLIPRLDVELRVRIVVVDNILEQLGLGLARF